MVIQDEGPPRAGLTEGVTWRTRSESLTSLGRPARPASVFESGRR